MASASKTIFWLFVAFYVVSLVLFAVGTFGWFGQERDPLSAVFLIPLGLPWNLMLGGAIEGLRPWLAALTPLLNLAVIGGVARLVERK